MEVLWLDRAMEFAVWFRRATGGRRAPYSYQTRLALADAWPQLLRAPTGAGKTAAVTLAWLWRRRQAGPAVRRSTPRRLVWCLPMRVLAEQTHAAITEWLGNLGLLARRAGEAGQVLPVLLMGGQKHPDWWLYPEQEQVLVGTQEMLLSRALCRGYGASRYQWPVEFGLLHNDALWVLDEVQLMGEGMATTAQLQAWRERLGTLRPACTLWVSATVAPEWLATVDHPAPGHVLEPDERDYADVTTDLPKRWRAEKVVQRSPVPGSDLPGLAAEILRNHRPGTLTLAVVNTVERAVQLHAALAARVPQPGPALHLVHGRFRPRDRRQWLEGPLAPPPAPSGRIVVATQVVEAGVDLDACTLWTEVAPWPSLVQRFGRCNRYGSQAEARIFWLDAEPKPYGEAELGIARERLAELEGRSAAPVVLAGIPLPDPSPPDHMLRGRDLVGLFDTTPDLSGNDLDVSRFIRTLDDVDAYVFWREWGEGRPPAQMALPRPEELCPVPVPLLRKFLQGCRGWVLDHLEGGWAPADPNELRPGQAVLLPCRAGGYSPELGWTGREGRVPEVEQVDPAPPAESDLLGGDPESEGQRDWQPVDRHTEQVVTVLQRLVAELGDAGLPGWQQQALACAARWHDAGKGHPVFQETLRRLQPPAADAVWAKSPRRAGRHSRPHFRHELASALVFLATRDWAHDVATNLTAYLIAAHHGKVRLAIRSFPDEAEPEASGVRVALGVHEGDALGPVPLGGDVMAPATVLTLEPMELGASPRTGPSWLERVLSLRDHPELGPFRLSYLEALLRAADVRASAGEGVPHD